MSIKYQGKSLDSVETPRAEIKYRLNKHRALLTVKRFDREQFAEFEMSRKHIPFVEELLADLKSIPEEEN